MPAALPAWLRASDVGRIDDLYEVPAPTEVVITKLDETVEAGGVLHAALPSNIPIAYLCNGPRVPEDIREASVEAGVTIGSLDTEELWGRFSQNRGLYTVTASVDGSSATGMVSRSSSIDPAPRSSASSSSISV